MMIPELTDSGRRVRLPPGRDVVLTPRFASVVDSPTFQRLRNVRQLGPTHLVYPGAVHTRFEHSLGVFRSVGMCVRALMREPSVAMSLTEKDILSVLAAGLLHDLGHYPYAHSLEAVHRGAKDTPRHERIGASMVQTQLVGLLESELGVCPERVASLFTDSWQKHTGIDSLLASIISSAIDADKMDYLERDSAHLGVPYGRSFDIERLLSSLCVSEDGRQIAVAGKGKIPAEMFVFSRYMMFSEVYWHHTVRAASCMMEAALADYLESCELSAEELRAWLLTHSDDSLLQSIAQRCTEGSLGNRLVSGLMTPRRRLYKRVATFSRVYAESWKRQVYERLYAASLEEVQVYRDRMATALSDLLGISVMMDDVLIDTPPRDKDHPEDALVRYPDVNGKSTYSLREISTVVAGVHNDFVAVVKKIRIFMEPSLALRARERLRQVEARLADCILEPV